ncbi:hypothetical protein HPULCUR_009830 [Helicostylum pulchrum]|uniref:Transposase n=1 Tax=Helicostylum pulchrum TaxID=562976 RepID=A0ABP9YBL0_9FUNG
MDWIKQKELVSRAVEGIELVYDRLKTRKVCSNGGIMNFLNSAAAEQKSIHEFMKPYRHRENKGYAFSNRQASQDHAARVVIGTTHTDEPFKVCHTSTSKRRYRKRRLYRETIKQIYSQRPYPARPLPIRDLVQDSRRTVVAYGDASLKGTYKGNTPVPVKSIQRAIANKAIVIPVDEFRTSVTCSHCLRRLENVYNDTFLECNHR